MSEHPALANPSRVVCWFSCGATSAVATRLALKKYRGQVETAVCYLDTGSEHPDNERFLDDCRRWFDHDITVLKSPDFTDVWDVYEKTKYLVGIRGARCTIEMKKKVREAYQDCAGDLQVFGYDSGESRRVKRFTDNSPELAVWCPVYELGLTKADCLALVTKAGIELPAMYRLGYRNNNCIGCVKGGAGYWNKVRKDFPGVFARMAGVEIEMGVTINKSYAGDGKRRRVFLKDLPPDVGRYEAEPDMSCGIFCAAVLDELNEEHNE